MTFCVCIGPSIKFCCCEFFVNVFTKGLFLILTTPTLQILMAEIAVLLFLIFGYQLLAEFQCRIDLCMIDGYDLRSIMLTFLYLSVTIGDNGVENLALQRTYGYCTSSVYLTGRKKCCLKNNISGRGVHDE